MPKTCTMMRLAKTQRKPLIGRKPKRRATSWSMITFTHSQV
nr:MAG TPA: hypothetical protein [Herelleviridae sp.]